MLTTKVLQTEYGDGHCCVLIYDEHNYELFEMSNPLSPNGINMILSYGRIVDDDFIAEDTIKQIKHKQDEFGLEINNEELMKEENDDIRQAIKNRQEEFYPY